jgi:V/A-type H+-transporting ATPase subunit F
MRKDKIAVIGDKDSVLAFKAIGVDVFAVYSDEDARETLRKQARNYKVIFITEDIAEKISDIVNRYKSTAYPIVLPIPGSQGTTGYGMNSIKKDVEKAIGVDILFMRED